VLAGRILYVLTTDLLAVNWPGNEVIGHACDIDGDEESRDHVVGCNDGRCLDEEILGVEFGGSSESRELLLQG
jgi:hypothetical protein